MHDAHLGKNDGKWRLEGSERAGQGLEKVENIFFCNVLESKGFFFCITLGPERNLEGKITQEQRVRSKYKMVFKFLRVPEQI